MQPLSETYPYLTRFERAQVLAERAEQLSNGASPLVANYLPFDDALTIAMRELVANRIPMKVRRIHSDQSSFEDVELSKLVTDPTGDIASLIKEAERSL